jgi:Fic family protein
MEALGFEMRSEAALRMLTEDVVKTNEIEGEILVPDQVRSSIGTRLGVDIGGLPAPDRNVDGAVEMALDATRNYAEPLTRERLLSWHAALFPAGRSGMRRILAGQWRDDADGPMEVVSGPIGRQRVHYTAPPAERLADEIPRFLEWFESTQSMDPVLAAGIAHLWFVTIHPFDDGNGRIARAIADMALARSEESPERFYSMSAQIRLERNAYYGILETTQRHGLDVTDWQVWFLECLARHRKRSTYPRRHPDKGAFLGGPCPRAAERAPGQNPQPASRRFRRETHLVKVGDHERLFPGHSESRHPRSNRSWHLSP